MICESTPYNSTGLDKEIQLCNSIPNERAQVERPANGRIAGPLSGFQGNPKSESTNMQFDSVDLHWIWRETTRRLESFAGDVREHKRVLEASDFIRWLQFSGLLKLFAAHPQPEPLRVDVANVRKLIEDLRFSCGESFRNGKADPQYAASDIAAINHKLELIAAHVATLSPPLTETAASGDSAEPGLRVIQGGV